MTTITKSATAYDANGYLTAQDVAIIDHGDTISIHGHEHLKSDLVIEPNKITGLAGWYLTW